MIAETKTLRIEVEDHGSWKMVRIYKRDFEAAVERLVPILSCSLDDLRHAHEAYEYLTKGNGVPIVEPE